MYRAGHILRTNLHTSRNMVFIVLHNDGQFTNHSPQVIGAFDDYNASCMFGWKTVIEAAKKPWTVRFYKNRKGEFADCCGLGWYYIEEWNTATNKRMKTISLGEKKTGSKMTCVLDAYLKEHYDQYDQLMQDWSEELASNNIPIKLQDFTFVSEEYKE